MRLRFETAPDGVCGIELSANGQKVAWSISDYLATLDQKVGALIAAESKPAPKSDVKPKPEAEHTPPVPVLANAGAK